MGINDSIEETPTALARALVKVGRTSEAEAVIARLIAEEFHHQVRSVSINSDAYSLNSLNGFVDTDKGAFFFKFHQEEGEGRMTGEYYRARILAEAGLPVDLPLEASTAPGRQILLYRLRRDRRLAEVARDLDREQDPTRVAGILQAQATLDRAVAAVYLKTLHPISASQSEAEPIHRLFHERLRDFDRPSEVGGRFAGFYRDQDFNLPGVALNWRDLSRLTISVNGTRYSETLGSLFNAAFTELRPAQFAGAGVVAHGDAHNANVWVEDAGMPHLVLFDPAFAGEHVPALLAEVKPTFHNIFAHPYWLYEPKVAETGFKAKAERRGDVLAIETDYALSPLRQAFLDAKRDLLWRPLLSELRKRGQLPGNGGGC